MSKSQNENNDIISEYDKQDWERDAPYVPMVVGCNNCGYQWDEKKDPCPSALCHRCHGRGYSTHPIENGEL